MGYSRVPQKVDANQASIVKALRKAGASVVSTSSIGDGFVDLVVGWRGSTHMLEVKNPEYRVKSDPGKDLSDDEIKFAAAWRGSPIRVVYTVADALAAIGVSEDDVTRALAAREEA